MAYSVPFVKLNVEGHFGSSTVDIKERWQAGFHITKNGGVIGGTSELSSFLTNIRAAVQTYHTTAAVGAGTTAFCDAVSGAYIGTDGRYALGALQSTTRVPLASSVAGVGTPALPWSTAGVITLRSLLTRGPASHGRVYWPATGQSYDKTTGVVAAATVTTWVTAAKTLVDALNAVAATNFGTGSNVGLVSAKLTGYQSPVIRVGIGQKLDSMESRERDIPEAHQFLTTVNSTLLLAGLDDDFRDAMRDEFPDADLP
jgi:hypothetical protein